MPLPRRERRLEVHWSADEWAVLRARCGASRSLAAYVRAAALGQPAPVAAGPAVPELNAEQYAALGRAAGNLNQIAKHLNQGAILTDRDLLPVLRQLYADVQQVRRRLIGAEALATPTREARPSRPS